MWNTTSAVSGSEREHQLQTEGWEPFSVTFVPLSCGPGATMSYSDIRGEHFIWYRRKSAKK